jgi:superfamily II DNA/RNA helicase
MKVEDYVHRIGRTGRAGRMGLAITLAERRDTPAIRRIEQFTTQRIAVATVPGMEPRAVEARPSSPAKRPGKRPAPAARHASGERRAPSKRR